MHGYLGSMEYPTLNCVHSHFPEEKIQIIRYLYNLDFYFLSDIRIHYYIHPNQKNVKQNF